MGRLATLEVSEERHARPCLLLSLLAEQPQKPSGTCTAAVLVATHSLQVRTCSAHSASSGRWHLPRAVSELSEQGRLARGGRTGSAESLTLLDAGEAPGLLAARSELPAVVYLQHFPFSRDTDLDPYLFSAVLHDPVLVHWA